MCVDGKSMSENSLIAGFITEGAVTREREKYLDVPL